RVADVGGRALAVAVVVRREARVLDVHRAEAGERLRRRAPALPARGHPRVVAPGDLLDLVAVHRPAGHVGRAVRGGNVGLLALERGLVGLAHRAPPAVAGLPGVAPPALHDLVAV